MSLPKVKRLIHVYEFDDGKFDVTSHVIGAGSNERGAYLSSTEAIMEVLKWFDVADLQRMAAHLQ